MTNETDECFVGGREYMEITVNNECRLELPQGFRVLTEEERNKLSFAKDGEGICLHDEQRHILISIGYKKVGLLSFLVKPKDVVKTFEKSIAKAMKSFGYKLEEFKEKQVGNKCFEGFRYAYSTQGVDMAGESLIGKSNTTFYYMHVYVRATMLDNFDVWNETLDGVVWLHR